MRSWAACWALTGVVACGGAGGSKVRQLGGMLDIRPATVDFGDVALGKDATIAVRLQNDGIVPMAELEKQTILNALTQVNGDKMLAARLLGIGKTTLYR